MKILHLLFHLNNGPLVQVVSHLPINPVIYKHNDWQKKHHVHCPEVSILDYLLIPFIIQLLAMSLPFFINLTSHMHMLRLVLLLLHRFRWFRIKCQCPRAKYTRGSIWSRSSPSPCVKEKTMVPGYSIQKRSSACDDRSI